jgi:hypothetical protein
VGERETGGWHWGLAAASLLTLLVCRAIANVVLWRTGFAAISDDDYARVTIAQAFASAPHWDASGTSWLPFPFWLNGSAMMMFGTSLAVAKGCAFVLSLCCTALTFLAARWLGLALAPAFYGSLAATLLPHSLWLDLATVPEGYTAALCLVSLASLSRFEIGPRAVGAAALCAATLCRYESWPLAVGFAVCTALDVRRGRLAKSSLAIVPIALLGVSAWLLHGALSHGSALFFLTRVAQYKQALAGAGAPQADLWTQPLLHHPSLLVRGEPELMMALLCGVVALPKRAELWRRHRRAVGHGALLLGFLMLGDLLDGAATHHAERTLLASWLVVVLLTADAWSQLLALPARRHLAAAVAFTAGAVLINGTRARIVPDEPFVDRRTEVGIGLLAQRVVGTQPGVVAIHTLDYGYHAVIAAMDLADRGQPAQRHDPRHPDPAADEAQLHSLGARWLIADKSSPLSRMDGKLQAENARFVMIQLSNR